MEQFINTQSVSIFLKSKGAYWIVNNFDPNRCLHMFFSFHSIPGFFSGPESTQLAEFQKASSTLRDSYRFAHTTDLGLGHKHGVESE